MASLNSGVLVKLLEDMNSDEKPVTEHRLPMLQVRSIVPVMEEGNLWPNRGFYLKVSDSSHAMYVSLPHECDEMILNNQLQLGQYIYVQKLESATPVPVVRGIKVAPGKHPCVGSPEDLVFTKDLIGCCGVAWSDSDSKSRKDSVAKKPMERPRSLSASRAHQNAQGKLRSARLRSIPRSPRNGLAQKTSDIVTDLSDISVSCSDRDSDSDNSSFSWCVKPKATRRSWNGSKASLKEWSGSPIVKREIKPIVRSRSAGFPPCSTRRYDTDDDNSSCKSSIKRTTRQDINAIRSSHKQRVCALKEKQEIPKPVSLHISGSDRVWTETTVSWGSLSSNLVKLGKEVLQQRDAALSAAVEALQEACATERLIQCLSTYSDLVQRSSSSSSKDEEAESKVDSLLDLHDNITRMQQQQNKEETSEINKCAFSWVKAAVASDIAIKPPLPTSSPRKLRNNTNSDNWHALMDLDSELQGECNKCFLAFVDDFLDKTISSAESDDDNTTTTQLAGVMCRRIKRVDDWLDLIINNHDHDHDDHLQTCHSLKTKLYTLLLKHVERTAIAAFQV